MNKEELYYLANICYYDFDSEDDFVMTNAEKKIAEYNEKKQNNLEKSPYEVQRKIEDLINKKKMERENNQYKDAFEGFYTEMMSTLNAISRALEMNPNDKNLSAINDVYIGVLKRINWWKEKCDIPVDENSPKMEY